MQYTSVYFLFYLVHLVFTLHFVFAGLWSVSCVLCVLFRVGWFDQNQNKKSACVCRPSTRMLSWSQFFCTFYGSGKQVHVMYIPYNGVVIEGTQRKCTHNVVL